MTIDEFTMTRRQTCVGVCIDRMRFVKQLAFASYDASASK